MIFFLELPFDQQQALYHDAARQVLEMHGIVPNSLVPITFENNATFRVRCDTADYALRVYRPHQSSGSAIRSELAWLGALGNETDLRVPRPLILANGEALIRVRNEHSTDALYAAVFGWITGEALPPEAHTPAIAERIGATIGRLHAHSRHFSRSGNYPRRKLTADQFVFWRLINQHTPILFTPEHHAIFALVERRIKIVLGRFAPDDYDLIHADLMVKNIVLRSDEVCLIDFESCGWGYYAYDLAPLLLSYWNKPHYAALRAAVLAGYRREQPPKKRCSVGPASGLSFGSGTIHP